MIAHEGASERRDTWASGPFTVRRQAPDVRAGGRMSRASRGARCPGLGPDVRVGVADSSSLWIACVGFLGRRRMSGPSRGAGCPGVGRMSGRCRVAWLRSLSGPLLVGGAGCPGSCRMSGRCSSAATPLEALLDPLPCELLLCFEHLHGCLLSS